MSSTVPARMTGAVLPGDSRVELREFDVPTPGHAEVLIRTKSSTICGSDIRCIYHEHLGKGPEGYQKGTGRIPEYIGILPKELQNRIETLPAQRKDTGRIPEGDQQDTGKEPKIVAWQ